MQNTHRLLTLLVVIMLLGVSAGLSQVPTITSFAPASGAIGSSVTITGTNFDTPFGSNVVRFGGGVTGTVTAGSATSLTVTVPPTAVYGQITVTSNGLTAYTRNPFKVTFAYNGAVDTALFAAPVSYNAGVAASEVAVGDLDGDGKSDVLVANNAGEANSVSVFRNTSTTKGVVNSSSFAAAQTITTGSRPWGIGVGDFDGDGKLDFAVVNGSDNSVSIYRNTSPGPGTISFTAKIDSSTGLGPHDLVVEDIDNDGKPDIIVTNYNGGGAGSISILRNTSTLGSLQFAHHFDQNVDAGPRGLDVGDLDFDGKVDIVVACYDGGTIHLLKNASTPGTLAFDDKGFVTSILTPVCVSMKDIDGDGDPDIVAAGYGDGVWIQRVEGSFDGWESPVIYHKAPGQGSIMGADVDGDAMVDILTANALETSFKRGTITLFENVHPGSGTFTPETFSDSINFTLPSLPFQVAIADIDGDGRPDLIGANYYNSTMSVLRNRSLDTLTITVTASGPGSVTPSGAIKVTHGLNAAFTFAPTGGNHLDSVVVDGVNLHVLTVDTLKAVAVNHTITAYFSAGAAFAITSSAGAGGSISPLGVVNVTSGGSQSYTITPNAGFALDSLIVDGAKVPSASPYIFTNVTATHTIRAVFTTGIRLNVSFFLQGPAAADTMGFNLKSTGTLAAKFTAATIPGRAIDSVSIEIRDQQTAAGSTIRLFAGAWLKSDGTIANYADTTLNYVTFVAPSGPYYVVVRHRNHIAVMSAATVALSGTAAAYDFTTGQAQAFGTNPMVLVGTKFCLIAGDADGSGVIDAGDRSAAWNQRNLLGYFGEDCDLSGVVDAGDQEYHMELSKSSHSGTVIPKLLLTPSNEG